MSANSYGRVARKSMAWTETPPEVVERLVVRRCLQGNRHRPIAPRDTRLLSSVQVPYDVGCLLRWLSTRSAKLTVQMTTPNKATMLVFDRAVGVMERTSWRQVDEEHPSLHALMRCKRRRALWRRRRRRQRRPTLKLVRPPQMQQVGRPAGATTRTPFVAVRLSGPPPQTIGHAASLMRMDGWTT